MLNAAPSHVENRVLSPNLQSSNNWGLFMATISAAVVVVVVVVVIVVVVVVAVAYNLALRMLKPVE